MRLPTPSFEYTFCKWLLTVRTDKNSRSAMSLLDTPCAASVAMSRSRGVSGVTITGMVRAGVRAPSHDSARVEARTLIAADAAAIAAVLQRLRGLGSGFGREEQRADRLELVGRVDEPLGAPRCGRLGMHRVRRDELTLADVGEILEAADDRRRITESDDLVQQPRLRPAVARRASELRRIMECRARRRQVAAGDESPAPAELLFGESKSEGWELRGLARGLGRGGFVAGTRSRRRELGQHEATRPVEPARRGSARAASPSHRHAVST